MAQIVRIFTALPATPDVADYSFDPVAPFPVVRMNVEASAQEHGGASAFAAKIIVRDVVNGVVAAPVATTGTITVAPWIIRNATLQFALPPAITAIAAAGNKVEIEGILRVGAVAGGSNIDFASTLFVWAF